MFFPQDCLEIQADKRYNYQIFHISMHIITQFLILFMYKLIRYSAFV